MSTKNVNALTSKQVNLNFEITKEDVVECIISRDSESVSIKIEGITKKIKTIFEEEKEFYEQADLLIKKDIIDFFDINEDIQEENSFSYMITNKNLVELFYTKNRQLALYSKDQLEDSKNPKRVRKSFCSDNWKDRTKDNYGNVKYEQNNPLYYADKKLTGNLSIIKLQVYYIHSFKTDVKSKVFTTIHIPISDIFSTETFKLASTLKKLHNSKLKLIEERNELRRDLFLLDTGVTNIKASVIKSILNNDESLKELFNLGETPKLN